MGHSHQRERFFEKNIRPQPTAELYIKALSNSPYRTHRRMALALNPMLEDMVKQAEEEFNKMEREKELNEFAKTLEVA
jgi:hypothetical protein